MLSLCEINQKLDKYSVVPELKYAQWHENKALLV